VLDAVPLDVSINATHVDATVLVLDLLTVFPAGTTPYDATEYVYNKHVNMTTGLVKMNPGYESQTGKKILDPKINHPPATGLVDYIVKERLFNLYLPDGCIPLTHEHALMKKIAENNPWPKPIAVMGYDNTVVFAGGDFFEAETSCVKEVAMGQIASAGTINLAYFSRKPALTTPLPHNAPTRDAGGYNASKTYISFLIGDGDNMDYLQSSRRDWITGRVAQCNGTCPYPLLWTMNPHVMHLAPDWAQWYAEQLLLTKTDRFALPPSGDLYSYPSEFPKDQQATFVANTERDCQLLSTTASTAWEFAGNWGSALEEYFPRYGPRGIVESLVTVNVPYDIPTLAFGDDMYKVVGATSANSNSSVVFKPHEWRGIRGANSAPFSGAENMNVTAMAAQINGYPAGTVTAIYVTSDGGANLSIIDQLAKILSDHVEIVGLEIGEYAKEHAKLKAAKEPQ